MNKRFKRVSAAMMAGTMAFGMGATAFAAETSGSTTGSGDFEGHVNKSVLSVQLPTVPESGDTTFAFIVDPEGLIAATEGAKHTGATFEQGASVYFQSAANTYTKDSSKLKVINKGSVAADVTVKAKTTEVTNVTMADSTTFSGTDAELYLGLLVADKDAVAIKAGDANEVSVKVGLAGVADNYEVTYNADQKKYEYTAKSGVADSAWNSFEFGLTGACNTKGNWSAESLAAPNVEVTWSYEEHPETGGADMLEENASAERGPSIAVTSYNYDRTATFDITADLGAGADAATKITTVKIGPDGTTFGTDLTSACVIDNSTGKITFPSGKLGSANVGDKKYIQVSFDKGSPVVLTLTITK